MPNYRNSFHVIDCSVIVQNAKYLYTEFFMGNDTLYKTMSLWAYSNDKNVSKVASAPTYSTEQESEAKAK